MRWQRQIRRMAGDRTEWIQAKNYAAESLSTQLSFAPEFIPLHPGLETSWRQKNSWRVRVTRR
jgi:hypothetical protein